MLPQQHAAALGTLGCKPTLHLHCFTHIHITIFTASTTLPRCPSVLTCRVHQLGGQPQLAVRARHRQAGDVAVHLRRLLLPVALVVGA